tara:strand:+ start:877 stop:2319 length:1443 start_codon:yes stop_codon:yes gene_type:complete
MADEMYADQVQNIRDKLAQLQEQKIENYDDMANSITDKYNEKMKAFEDKWKAVSDAGGEELAGLAGAKSIYAGGKKLRDLYKARKERTKAQREKEQGDELDDDFDEDAEPLDGDVSRAVAGDDDSPVDFYNEDGDKYFTGTEADHDQYYNDDGTLKDPTQIPDGHQHTEAQQEDDGVPDAPEEPPEAPTEATAVERPLAPQDIDVSDVIGGPRTKRLAQLQRFNAQQDAQPAEEPATEPAQPSFEDVVAQGQRERMQRLQGGDDAVDQPTSLVPQDAPVAQPTTLRRPPPRDTTDPFQPAPRDAPTLRSEFTRRPPDAPQDENPNLIGGGQEGLSEVGGEGSSLLERAGQKAFSSLAQRGQTIRKGFSAVKDFFSPSGGASAGAEGAEAGAEAGGEALAGLGTTDAVLGAIPVVGELALAVSGFVAIGEGIYHLFHPDKKPPAPKASAPLTAPQALTQKYAMALPSTDNAVDRSATTSAF